MTHLFKFDVMIGDRFECSMQMPYNPLFPIATDEIEEFIISHRPSLAKKHYHIEF